MLLDLQDGNIEQGELDLEPEELTRGRLMATMDKLNDRFGRGGDHTEMLNAGFPAVRLSVAVEDYNHQHQDLRVEKGVTYGDTVEAMDFPYLAKVTRLNTAALAALASAPSPPDDPQVAGAVQTFTSVSWRQGLSPTATWLVRWRRTDANEWQHHRTVPTPTCQEGGPRHLIRCEVALRGIRVDDWVFGVSSVSADGYESPVASAVPGGAFKPHVASTKPK